MIQMDGCCHSRSIISRGMKLCLVVGLIGLLVLADGVQASQVIFTLKDPPNDDKGSGAVVYPLHESFEPGLFDLRRFHVWQNDEYLYFDVTFARVTNPWNAPEGFFHQLIDIYIDAEQGGHTQPAAPGVGVEFDKHAGWEYRLRIQPWGGSRWLDARYDPGRVHPVTALLLPDERTIRAQVPLAVTGTPARHWQFYVLVGGFDAFGPDHYRVIRKAASQWYFGGGDDRGAGPNVVDLLTGGLGSKSQARQLESYDPEIGKKAVLVPVGNSLSLPFTVWHLVGSCLVLLGLGGIFWVLWCHKPGATH